MNINVKVFWGRTKIFVPNNIEFFFVFEEIGNKIMVLQKILQVSGREGTLGYLLH